MPFAAHVSSRQGTWVRLLSALTDLVINPGWVFHGAKHLPFPSSKEKRNRGTGMKHPA